MVRPPVPPTYFFVIDVSRPAIDMGVLKIFANILKEVIE